MASKFDWIPTVSFGKFRFGAPVQRYVDEGLLTYDPAPEELGGDAIYIDEEADIWVYPDDEGRGVVGTVSCGRSALYGGRELLGLAIGEAVEILGRDPDEFEEGVESADEIEDIAYFDDMGLMLWFRDGVSVSVTVDNADYGEDDG